MVRLCDEAVQHKINKDDRWSESPQQAAVPAGRGEAESRRILLQDPPRTGQETREDQVHMLQLTHIRRFNLV